MDHSWCWLWQKFPAPNKWLDNKRISPAGESGVFVYILKILLRN